MPNHITNILTVTGKAEEVKKLFQSIWNKYDEEKEIWMDFNKIMPMPESLNIESGSKGDDAYELLFGHDKEENTLLKMLQPSHEELQKRFGRHDVAFQRESLEIAMKYRENVINYGHRTWYTWSTANWGTKWNAYGQEKRSDNTIKFETAWSAPIELMKHLSMLFPNVQIELKYADEDTGANCGIINYEKGLIKNKYQPESQSNEAYELAFDVDPDNKQYYELINGKYQYKDDE